MFCVCDLNSLCGNGIFLGLFESSKEQCLLEMEILYLLLD